MAKNDNNLDPNFDALLKSHVKRQGVTNVVTCDQFDPDTANAYLEHALTKNALVSFESHLSDCPTCRRQVIELLRMMPVSPAVLAPTSEEKAASLMDRVRDWFTGWSIGALAGFGAVAATVLLIATIVYRPARETQVVTSLPQASVSPIFPDGGQGELSPISRSAEMRAKSNSSATPAGAVGTPAPQAEAAGQAPLAESQAAPAEKSSDDRKEVIVSQTRQMEDVNRSQNQMRNFRELAPSGPAVNQAQAERSIPAPATAPVASAAPPPPPAKASEKAAERWRAADTSVLADAQSKKTEAKQSASEEEAAKSAKEKNATGAALAMRKPERPSSITRTIGSKVFLFENGIWTDTAYDAGKALPLIRLRQDSEEYRQVLKKIPSLKPFFDLNPIIVVWQEKVYRVEKK